MLRYLWKWLVGLVVVVAVFHRHEAQQVAVAALLAVLTAMNPFAAAGASFGCFFYLAYPSQSQGMQRWMYCAFSWGIGYAAAVFFYGDGPPYSQKGMVVAAAVSAFAVLVFVALGGVIRRDGNLPPWLESLLGIVFPFRAKRGEKNAD